MGCSLRQVAFLTLAYFSSSLMWAQVIEFESNGLHYKTLTRSGVTIMMAELPSQVRKYAVIQVAISNGSPSTRTFKPEDFHFEGADGTVIPALEARIVVGEFLAKASRNDVIQLVSTYETGLYGMSRFKSTNGYEQRREAALAEVNSARLKAAAAASAIAFAPTRLVPGESTDGAIFFPNLGKPLTQGKIVATPGTERFEFEIGGLTHPGELQHREKHENP
jgi:hypothetical protein